MLASDVKSIFTGVILWQSLIFITKFTRCERSTVSRRRLEPRVFTTRYGSLVGMIFKRENLLPTEVFSGLQFASTRQKRLRFMPPSGTLEKWLGTRVFYNTSFRGVCPQREKFTMQNEPLSFEILQERLHHIKQYITYRREECLMLNLNIPRKGNVGTYIFM